MGLVILTGASGSGKTTIARAFSTLYPDVARTLFFDSIGVPSAAEMVEQFGSCDEWQRIKTIEWMSDISGRLRAGPILFEGQMRLAFIHEATRAAGIADYKVVLVDCEDETRQQRLIEDRRQPELASPDMMNWARYLRDEAAARGDRILDTTNMSVPDATEILRLCF